MPILVKVKCIYKYFFQLFTLFCIGFSLKESSQWEIFLEKCAPKKEKKKLKNVSEEDDLFNKVAGLA